MKTISYQIYLTSHLLSLVSISIYAFAPINLKSNCKISHLSAYDPSDNPFTRTSAPEVPLSSDVSQLPDTFSDAIQKAARKTADCISSGKNRIRIDFDTSVGDQTYTSIKNTIPMAKEFSIIMSQLLDLTMTIDDGEEEEEEIVANSNSAVDKIVERIESPMIENTSSSSADSTPTPTVPVKTLVAKKLPERPIIDPNDRTMRIYFPDMGQAALARRDWKMGSEVSEVPPCVYTANIKNDEIQPTDKVIIILCPLASEVDSVQRIMAECSEKNVPLIMINPDLINMDVGFGMRARNLRENVLGTFLTSYKLKTMPTGALVREWPNGFSVWNEDATAPDGSGYRLLQTFKNDPTRNDMNELYDAANDPSTDKTPKGPNPLLDAIVGVRDFFDGMSKL